MHQIHLLSHDKAVSIVSHGIGSTKKGIHAGSLMVGNGQTTTKQSLNTSNSSNKCKSSSIESVSMIQIQHDQQKEKDLIHSDSRPRHDSGTRQSHLQDQEAVSEMNLHSEGKVMERQGCDGGVNDSAFEVL
jgi:hypothetical protein